MKKALQLILSLLLTTHNFAQNNSLKFDGNDCVDISSNFGLGTTNVSVECWVFIPTVSEKGTFVNIGGANDGYGIGVGSSTFDNSGNELIFINDMISWHGTGVNIGTGWHHVAFTIDAGRNSNIYLDGKNVLSFTETPRTPLNFTCIGQTSSGVRLLSNGKIDEVRIWNSARSEAQIKANMFKELSGNESNLVAYYNMNQSSGTTLASNLFSGGIDGNITGSVWQTSGAFSGPKRALDFDGSDDKVTSSLSFNNASAITIEGWIYPRSFNPLNPDANISNIAGFPDASALVRIGDAMIENNQLQFILLGTNRLNSNQRLSANTWYHFAAVYDGSTMRLYINGKLDNTLSAVNSFNSAGSFTLGQDGSNGRAFDGLLDEIRIWSDARTAQEIRTNMTKSLTGNESGLLAYYRFDYTDGTILYDNSANGINGTLSNMNNSDWVSSTAFTTWIGAETSDWNNAANWSGNSVPTDFTGNLGIYSYTDGNDLLSNTYGAVTGVNNIIVSTNSAFNLSSDLYVTGNLILESNMNFGIYNINFGDTGHLLEDAGTAGGTSGLITFSKNYGATPLSSENVGGLGLILTCGDSPGYVTVYRGFEQSSGSITNGIERYYNFNIQYGQPVDILFPYLESEVTGIESNLGFFQCVDNLEGGPYNWNQENSAVINHSANTISLSGFSPSGGITYRFTAADDPSLLPVELSSFSASLIGSNVKLSWNTATEINNYGFEIERSVISNGVRNLSWEKVGFVNGNGNSNSPKSYSFVDDKVTAGKYSYRLKQIDNDGQFEYSKTIEVDMNGVKKFELSQNYPNPFNPSTTIKFNLPEAGMVKLTLYNILGQEMRTLVNEFKESGAYTINFDANEFNSGIYIYKIETGSFTQTRKMTLIK